MASIYTWQKTKKRFSAREKRPDADCESDYELLTATVRIKVKNTQHVGWQCVGRKQRTTSPRFHKSATIKASKQTPERY
jgi:hypothetical protein